MKLKEIGQQLQDKKYTKLVPSLLNWFAESARDLPWRRTRDPYAIWVSEIMLQQTQVKTVIPFWERWMRELPTIQSLADAPSEKIHKLWEGLGYYTRVRNMQKAAWEIVATGNPSPGLPATLSPSDGERAGVRGFPRNFEDVLALPGIGRYTAGAICSIAFNQPTPILDGNVIRVLTRVFGIAENPRERETNARLWKIAEELVSRAKDAKVREGRIPKSSQTSRPSRDIPFCSYLNQSLMELGALICTPRQPRCESCPIRKVCVAFQENRIEEFPNLGKREKATARRFAAFVVERDEKFLVRQRPAGVVNAHLWEFPNVELNGEADWRVIAKTTLGFRPAELALLCSIKHSITRYRMTLDAYRINPGSAVVSTASFTDVRTATRRRDGGAPRVAQRWLTISELGQLSFPSAHKKILAKLADGR